MSDKLRNAVSSLNERRGLGESEALSLLSDCLEYFHVLRTVGQILFRRGPQEVVWSLTEVSVWDKDLTYYMEEEVVREQGPQTVRFFLPSVEEIEMAQGHWETDHV